MKAKEFLDVSGTTLLFIGFFLAFLPHVFHARIGLSEQTHLKHVITGITLALIALAILIWNNKALKTFK
ncbi:hypothetical protein J4204_04475 [Candidatus Woesearchaeota archaeon]|nr:hypothetical protein [Candidatus Woesearchaeota archaeon]